MYDPLSQRPNCAANIAIDFGPHRVPPYCDSAANIFSPLNIMFNVAQRAKVRLNRFVDHYAITPAQDFYTLNDRR